MKRLTCLVMLLCLSIAASAAQITVYYSVRTVPNALPSPPPMAYLQLLVDGSTDPHHQGAPVSGTWTTTVITVGTATVPAGAFYWSIPAGSYIRVTCSYTGLGMSTTNPGTYQTAALDVNLNAAVPAVAMPAAAWSQLVVPYTGAAGAVDLGAYKLAAKYLRSTGYATSALPTGAAGDLSYDTTTNTFKFFNGSIWSDLGGAAETDPIAAHLDVASTWTAAQKFTEVKLWAITPDYWDILGTVGDGIDTTSVITWGIWSGGVGGTYTPVLQTTRLGLFTTTLASYAPHGPWGVDHGKSAVYPYATQKWVNDGYQPAGSYLTSESDPSVSSWAKAATKPSYTAAEVGAIATGGETDPRVPAVGTAGNVMTSAGGVWTSAPPAAAGAVYPTPDGAGWWHSTGAGVYAWSTPTAANVGAAATSHAHSAADVTSGNLSTLRLPTAAADLGAADVNLNLGNTNGSYNTNLTTDGTVTATAGFVGSLTGTASGNLTATSPLTHDQTASYDGVQTVRTGALRWYPPAACTLVSCTAYAGTAPTGATLTVDVKKNGTTVLASVLSIAIGANTSTGAPTTPTTTAMTATDYLTWDIDQIGSTEPGRDVSVRVVYTIP